MTAPARLSSKLDSPVRRNASLRAVGAPVAAIPEDGWFDFLEALQGWPLTEGTVAGIDVGAGRVEVADWAPFDRIVELVVREDHGLRRRRFLIDVPRRIDAVSLGRGLTRVCVSGLSEAAVLLVPTTRSGSLDLMDVYGGVS